MMEKPRSGKQDLQCKVHLQFKLEGEESESQFSKGDKTTKISKPKLSCSEKEPPLRATSSDPEAYNNSNYKKENPP